MASLLTHRGLHFGILVLLLLGALIFGGSNSDLRASLQNLVFDNYLEWTPRPASDQVIIIDYDDASLARVGQWPWPRDRIAAMVDALSELDVAVIAFDGVLAEPDRASPHRVIELLPEDNPAFSPLRTGADHLPDNDLILAEAIKNAGMFVAGFTHGQIPNRVRVKSSIRAKGPVKTSFIEGAQRFINTAVFLPELVRASAGHGSFMAEPQFDGIIRETGLIFSDGKTLYPSLSLEAVRLLAPRGEQMITLLSDLEGQQLIDFDKPYRIRAGTHVIPSEADGKIRVWFRSFDRARDYVSAWQLLDPGQHDLIRPKIESRVALIGSIAEGLTDLRSSPLDLFIPGVEVHANVVEQILQSAYLYRSLENIIAELAFILVGGALMIIMAPFVSAVAMLIICTQLIVLAAVGSWLMFNQFGILLDPVYPSLAVFLIFVVSSLFTYLRSEAERKQVRQAFGLYISPSFMEELTKDPDKLKLGGEVRDLTVMFTDIRSFTTISEDLTPEQLIQLMNDFLTPMSNLVMENRGTIDKYMGDAMMAFWNAPLDDAQHARRACLAALGMNKALMPINERVKAQAEAEHRTFHPLAAGIGINTGPCSVGNMGSKQRFAYSALGDAVNLASRLEGQTKEYGVRILIGEETYKHVPEMATLELDLIQVKGKNDPVHLYTLIGDERVAESTAFKLWKHEHEDMLEAYRSGDFIQAENILMHAKERADLEMVDYYLMMSSRIEAFQKDPPPDDWNGVYIATSK